MTYYAANAGGWVYQDAPTRAEAEADRLRDECDCYPCNCQPGMCECNMDYEELCTC